jgi:mevalonate kinase
VWSSSSSRAVARKASDSSSSSSGGGGGGDTIGVLKRRVDGLAERVHKALDVVDVARLDAAVSDLEVRASEAGAYTRSLPRST